MAGDLLPVGSEELVPGHHFSQILAVSGHVQENNIVLVGVSRQPIKIILQSLPVEFAQFVDVAFPPASVKELLTQLGDVDIVNRQVGHLHIAVVVLFGEDSPAVHYTVASRLAQRAGCQTDYRKREKNREQESSKRVSYPISFH